MKMRKGFTLIELSIVLIIIGLIVGAVLKGRDLINSAEYKKIYNTWIKEWQIAIYAYRDKTGALLGDGIANGGNNPVDDGKFDGVRLDTTTSVQERLREVGLDVPVSNIADSDGGSYSIKGKYTTSTAGAELRYIGGKNVLYISNVPTDVAIAFDTIVDGKLDPQDGLFRIYGSGSTWPNPEDTTKVNVYLEI